ncbi:MAG: copper-translocating P-type ATPase [Candidatus Sericytochromatia bacterium]|nr:MAG: copper-translocating P-type ATPase [Candidatus Sericytochromatia bacterium]
MENKNNSLDFKIYGMTCSACVNKVENELKKIDGISDVSVNLATEKAKVFFSKKIDESIIINSIEKIGYKACLDNKNNNIDIYLEKEIKNTKIKLIIGSIIGLILITGMLHDLGFKNIPHFFMNPYFQLVLTIPVQFWVGSKFLLGAWKSFLNKSFDMNTLVSLGTLSAFTFSLFATLFPNVLLKNNIPISYYYESSAIIIILVLLGKYIETKAKNKTSESIKSLINLQAKKAILLENGKEKEVEIEKLKINDIVLVKPGQKIPSDGIIIKGYGVIDESMITGESIPVEKFVDDKVIGSTININGSFEMKVTKIGENTLISQIVKLVENTQATKIPVQKIVDKVTSVFVPVIIFISLITFLVWLLIFKNVTLAFLNSISVLVIACPCAMGLATPTAIVVGVGRAAQLGILIKNLQILEILGKVNCIVTDKTGTLTKGKPELKDIVSFKYKEDEILKIIASLEKNSEHPLSYSILKKAKEKNIDLFETEYFENIVGEGIGAEINSIEYYLGNEKLMKRKRINIDDKYKEIYEKLSSEGKTPMYLCDEKEIIALISSSDTIKDDAKFVINNLKKKNIELIMITGDNKKTAEIIANELGIKNFYAEVLPQEKFNYIKKLQNDGKIVAMLGDGINDAPALSQANVSIAMGNGSDIAIESSDITIIKGDLKKVIQILALGDKIMKTIKQNLFWAFIYNIIFIPVASGLFYKFNIRLSPIFSALAMSLSSISVLSNSLRLKFLKI